MSKITQFQKEWCLSIIEKLYKKPTSKPFQTPLVHEEGVLSTNANIQPMDLETVNNKIMKDRYQTMKDFASDVRLIWYNAQSFYPKEHELSLMASDLSSWFEEKLKNYPVTSEEKWLNKLRKAEQQLDNLIKNPIPPKPVLDYVKEKKDDNQPNKDADNNEKSTNSQKV